MSRFAFIALCGVSLLSIQPSGPPPGAPVATQLTQAALHPAAFTPTFIGMHTLSPARHWPSVPFGAMRPAGVSWLALEPAKGQFDWQPLDFWVAQAESHHVQLDYLFLNTPRWASTRPDEPCNGKRTGCAAPPNPADWEDFVRALVTRYKGRISSYEIWNEPNAAAYWSGTPAEMADLAARAYAIVKSIDPAAIVASPSASSTGFPASHDAWLDQYLSAGGGKSADVIAWHGYAGRNDRPALPPEDLERQIQALRLVLDKHHLGQMPIWDTEGGWGRDNQLPDPNDQAAFLMRWYLVQFNEGVQRAYWYQWDNPDWGTLWRDDPGQGPTPAASALAQLQGWLTGVTAASPCRPMPNSTLWTCDLKNGDALYRVAWSTAAPAPMPASFKCDAFTEMNGIERKPSGKPVMVTSRPILFTLKAAHK